MFAGKTSELIRLVEREVYAKKMGGIFKPSFDTRYSKHEVVTHDGLRYKAYLVSADSRGVAEIYKITKQSNLNVIGVDEVQFFPSELIGVCERLVKEEKRVIASGLNLNFREEAFETTRDLMVRADRIYFLTAVCVKCGGEASRTQRLIDGQPASWNTPVVAIGGKELYEPRCRCCYHPPPDRPPHTDLPQA